MAGVKFVQVSTSGMEGLPGRFVYMQCDDVYDTIIAPGYLDSYLRTFGIQLTESDTIFCLMYNIDGLPTSKKVKMLNVRFVNGKFFQLNTSIYNEEVIAGKIVNTVMNYRTVAITAAQFNGMYAAPFELVPAQDADQLIVLDKVELYMTYNAAAYAAGGVAHIQYDSTANGAGVIASTTLSAATFQPTASTGFMFNTSVVPQTGTTCVGKSLTLSNITGAFTTGDSTMVAHVWYKIIAV